MATGDTFKIAVNQDHINQGCRRSSNFCPVALAMSEALHLDISVGDNQARVRGNAAKNYRLPLNAIQFISDFDDNRYVEPFEFFATEIKLSWT